MMKGFPSQSKLTEQKYNTVAPLGSDKHGIDVAPKAIFPITGTSETPTAVALIKDSVTSKIQQHITFGAPHGLREGDVLRFDSGALVSVEAPVTNVPSADTIVIPMVLSNILTSTCLFMRYVTLTLDSSGSLVTTPGPLQFILDGVPTQVVEDTVTPANNTPLPVKLVSTAGDVNITAGDLNVQSEHTGLNYDSIRIGDGTELLAINASNEALVKATDTDAALATLNAKDFATQTTLAALLAAFNAEDFATQATLNALLTAFNAEDFATQATLQAVLTELQAKADLAETQPVSLASQPLPTGAATEATLAAQSAKLPATLGEKAEASSLSVTLSTENDALLTSLEGKDFATETTLASAEAKLDQGSVLFTDTTPLGISGVFASAWFDVTHYAAINVGVVADQDGATDAIKIEFSHDGITVIHEHTANYTTGDGVGFSFPVEFQYARVTFTNGAVGQTSFTLQAIAKKQPLHPSRYTVDQGITGNQHAIVTSSVIHGQTTAGGGSYIPVKVTPSGSLTVEEANGHLTVVDQLDTPLFDATSTPINGSAGAFVEIVASTAADVKKLDIIDDIGEFIGIYTGAAASEVLLAVTKLGGGEIEAVIPSGTRISVRNMKAASIAAGNMAINLLG